MRKLLIGIVAFLVVIVGVLAIVPSFINVNKYHDRIQSELQQRLGRDVKLGEMKLSLLPPTFKVQNAVIGEDPKYASGRPFAQAEQLDVSVKLLPLLHGGVEVSSLRLQRPQVEMIRDAQGNWNFSTLGTHKEQQPKGQNQQALELDKFQINDGVLAITDLQKHQSRAVYDHIDLLLRDYAPGKPFSVDLAAHLPGQGKQVAKLEGKGGPIDDATMLNTPFDGTLTMDQVALSGVQKFLNSEALAGTDATVSGKAKVTNGNGKLASSGSLKLDDPVVKSVKIGYPITLDYDASDDLKSDVIQIAKGQLKLGQTPLSLSGSINTRSTPALADVKLNAQDISIAEIGRLAAAFGVALNPGMQMAGRLSADVHAQGATSSPALNGTVNARDVQLSGGPVPTPVKVSQIALQLTPQTVQSNDFTASSGGTAVNVKFAMSQYTTQQPSVDATLNTQNANVTDLLNIAKAAGISGVEDMNGSGLLSLNVHATGPVKNSAAMQFAGNGSLQNAQIKTATMTAPVAIRTANMRFSQNAATLDGLQATVGSTNATGNLTVKNFQAPNVQFALNADKVNAVELQQIFGAAPPAQQQPKRASFSLIPTANAATAPAAAQPSILTKMTGGGNVSVGTLQYDQLTLTNARTTVNLDHGLIHLTPVSGLLYGGVVNGDVQVDTRGANTVYNVNLKTQKVDSNKLLSSVSSVKDVLYGLLASNIQASFASVPKGEDIAKTLNGRVSINLSNGKLTKIDLLKQLGSVAKFVGVKANPDGSTNVTSLTGDLDVKNGVATTNNLKALIDGGTVAASGVANLVDQGLNMKLTAVLSKSMSSAAGGTGIGGLMSTALANKNGELVIPVLVTGTFQNPNVAPDTATIAQMKMNNLLPSFSNPGQLSQGLLGALGGGKGGQGGVGGVLDALTGRPKQNEQYQGQKPGAAANNQQQQQQGNQNVQDTVKGIVGMFGGKKGEKK